MKLDIPSIVGYRDADEIMLHAVMQIVVNFVEQELVEAHWESDEHTAGIKDIYDWWQDRPFRIDPGDEIVFSDGYLDDFSIPPELMAQVIKVQGVYDAWYEEDSEMMRRAVNLRQYMWT